MGRLEPRPVAEGDVVIRQGDPADRFYIINSGRVRVTQDGAGGERVLRDMGPDEVFGEIGLLRNSARTATVTAVGPGLLLALDRDDFLELVAEKHTLDRPARPPSGEPLPASNGKSRAVSAR